MKTVISKKLASIMPIREEIKINNINYLSGISFDTGVKIGETNTDYTLDIEATEFNFFCFNKNNKITCWPVSKGEQPLNDTGQWKKEGRQEIKPGKFLLLFTDYFIIRDANTRYRIEDNEIKDKIIRRTCEIFTDKIKGSNEELSFNISSDISKIYKTEAHDNSGYLLNSCMKDNSSYGCAPYSKFYDFVPGLQIVYKKIGESLLFRALLWNCKDNEGNEIKFLDRIYGTDQVNLQLIEKAKENGWAWRSFSNSSPYFNDKYINLQCKINRDAFNYLEEEGSPYVDTLNYLTDCGNDFILSNYKHADYTLTNCDGQAVNNSAVCCDCGTRIDENDCRYNDNGDCYCECCFNNQYSYCEHCDSIIDNDNMVNCDGNYYCEYCARNKGYDHCDGCGTWTKDCICIDNDIYCESCFSDRFQFCEHCEEDKRIDNFSNINLDGQDVFICDDCKSELNRCGECGNYFTDKLDNNLCPDCAETIEANKSQLELTFNE